jgi:signal transduction histidine kinase
MRLLTKNSLILLLITITIFTAGGFIFYARLQHIMREEAVEALYFKKNDVLHYINDNNQLPESISLEDHLKFQRTILPVKEEITDTALYVAAEEELIPFRQLSFPVECNGSLYKCTIGKSLMESDDLIETILQSFMLITALLILVFLLMNYFFSRSIWTPFLKTLQQISEYRIEKHEQLQLPDAAIHEFNQLNRVVEQMTKKISDDFKNLKSFTENAAHELQTPLAVITNKTEMLLQSEGLNEEQIREIAGINQTTIRLSKLNQTLLLLSKIENQQFATDQMIDFTSIVTKQLNAFEELAEMKSLRIIREIQPLSVKLHPVLADSIVTNLLSNAVKYTPESGLIEVKLQTHSFEVMNTGKALKANGKHLFQRFYKESEDNSSSGLGLALIKQIADVHHHTVHYEYKDFKHHFSYRF